MKLRFTNSGAGAFLSFCILSIGANGVLKAQNSAFDFNQNNYFSEGQSTQSSPTFRKLLVIDKSDPIGSESLSARKFPISSLKAIKFVDETGAPTDFAPSNSGAQSMQFNIGQGDLGELYKLLALYKSESGNGHTGINLTRKDQSGNAIDTFPNFRKYVADDDLGGYTPDIKSIQPAFIGIHLAAGSLTENLQGSNMVLVNESGVIEENIPSLSNTISLYPNPAQNFITVDLSGIAGTQITVFNIQGKLVKTIESSMNLAQQKIDIADLPAGVYIMNINTPNGQAVKKFSKIN